MSKLQLTSLHPYFDLHQLKYGDATLNSIYGAGCTNSPRIMFIFMNPTARNVAAQRSWTGIRAPWLGIKNIWKMFYQLQLLDEPLFSQVMEMKPVQWNESFSTKLYENIADKDVFITNLAKCTQSDAKHLDNNIFFEYLELLFQEIDLLEPNTIVTFGTQVSSIILGENIKISADNSGKTINIKNKCYSVVPVHYPVGHGQRNVQKSIDSIKKILDK
ncbi:MAG: uracil-DNA glycosylase family protein [Candidatus Berkelbacteria bacterium]